MPAEVACRDTSRLTNSHREKTGTTRMRLIGWLAIAGALTVAQTAWAQAPKLEKTRISLSVGGSISQMNKVAYFVALNRKYFQQEGLDVESVAFASGTAALQNLIGGNADVV